MDMSNSRQRQEQLKRYYAREKTNIIKERQSSPVVTIKDNARLRDAASNNLLKELSGILLHKTSKITREDINEAFLKACINGHTKAAHLLLKNEAFVDYQDEDLWAAIHFAAARGDKTLLSLLFEFNVDTTLLDVDGNFALDYAKDDTVKQIIAEEMAHSGVYPEDLPSIRTRQLKAMTAAVRSGITRGKDMTQFNKNGVTPLHTAAAYGYYEVTQLLVESGRVPLSIIDSFGCTPLHVAMKYGQTQVAKYLLQQGARMEESPYEIGGPLNLEALAGRSSPQPLSNRWKLKNITTDDTSRERSWLTQHIGLVQDTPPPPPPREVEDNLYNSLQDLNIEQNTMAYNRRKGSAPPSITSLKSIPEHTHKHTVMTTPIKHVIEDIYDYGNGTPSPRHSSPIPAHMSIYDDSVVATVLNSEEDIYDDLQSVDAHGRNEDLYDDVRTVMGLAMPPQGRGQPYPYEQFVRTKAPPLTPPSPMIEQQRVLVKNNSDSNIYCTRGYLPPQPLPRKTSVQHSQRPQSVDSEQIVPEAWLARMHPQLRKAYVPAPPLRRDSTPTKAPPPVPNRVGGVRMCPLPQPPPRQYVQPHPPTIQLRPVRERQLPSHPIDVPPTHQLNDYQLPPHLIEQALAPPHPPPTHLIDYAMAPPYSPPTHLIDQQQIVIMPHPPHSPITRMTSAPILPSSLEPHPLDPPPSYATVLHSPEQFSSTPISTPPITKPHPPQAPKPLLRKITSVPDSLATTDHIMYLDGNENNKKTERKVSAKPYTFRTKFQ